MLKYQVSEQKRGDLDYRRYMFDSLVVAVPYRRDRVESQRELLFYVITNSVAGNQSFAPGKEWPKYL